MSTTSHLAELADAPIDLARWPSLARPKPAPARAAVAAVVLRRVAARCRIRLVFADGSGYGPADGPLVVVSDPRSLCIRLARDGKIGFGEAYMAGEWDAPDLVAVVERLAVHIDDLVPRRLHRLRRLHEARQPASEDNDRGGARRNIARHYDLSNELFAAFLDETMSYSSALFTDTGESLAEAQAGKIDRLLDATGVVGGSTVLEIGTGWGELALRAARRGARVTTVTLSKEQAALAGRRVQAAGLADAVDVRVEDYRDVAGSYDAIVSVEMIEAVGERWWPTYFRTLEERLAPGGRVGVQSILIGHDRLLATKSSWTWIHKYIFPGGLIPSEEAIRQTVSTHTSLAVTDWLSFGDSYAETLRRWRVRFNDQADHVAALGFDHTFRRMWNFYLAYCEAGFRTGYLGVAQMILARGQDR